VVKNILVLIAPKNEFHLSYIHKNSILFSQSKFSKFITKTKELFALRFTGDADIRGESKFRALNVTGV